MVQDAIVVAVSSNSLEYFAEVFHAVLVAVDFQRVGRKSEHGAAEFVEREVTGVADEILETVGGDPQAKVERYSLGVCRHKFLRIYPSLALA